MPEPVFDPRLTKITADHPYPLVFMSISGAHLYGFPSPDSDYDLRGVHILPVAKMLGLRVDDETISHEQIVDGLELDQVTHDLHKFAQMLLKRDGSVLEQIFSPLVILTTPDHEALRVIAQGCITRNHSYHYAGFSVTQWRLFNKENPHRIKPLLYIFRVLLTGIYLMRSGQVVASLPELNEIFQLPYIPELIVRKQTGHEQATLDDADLDFFQREFDRLSAELEAAHEQSSLPPAPSLATYTALNDWIIQVRLKYG